MNLLKIYSRSLEIVIDSDLSPQERMVIRKKAERAARLAEQWQKDALRPSHQPNSKTPSELADEAKAKKILEELKAKLNNGCV